MSIVRTPIDQDGNHSTHHSIGDGSADDLDTAIEPGMLDTASLSRRLTRMVVVGLHLVGAKEVGELLGLSPRHAVHNSRGLGWSRVENVLEDGGVSVVQRVWL